MELSKEVKDTIRMLNQLAKGVEILSKAPKESCDLTRYHDADTFLTLRELKDRNVKKMVFDAVLAGNISMQGLQAALEKDILVELVKNGFLKATPEQWTYGVMLYAYPEIIEKGPRGLRQAVKEIFGDKPIELLVHDDYEDIMEYVERKAQQSVIPDPRVEIDGWKLVQLDPFSGLDLIVGDLVGSCQTWDGVGESCAKHAVKSKRGSTWVVYNPNGTMVAHSWVWAKKKHKDTIVIDNIESGIIRGNEKAQKMVAELYQQAIRGVIDSPDNSVEKVYVGTQYTRIHLLGYYDKGANPLKAPASYTDADEVYMFK